MTLSAPHVAQADIAHLAALHSTVLLSGGYDSATVLALLARSGSSVETIFVDYGQPARHDERRAAELISSRFHVRHRTVECDGFRLPTEGEIPGRNAFLVFAGLMAGNVAPGTLSLGIHGSSGYADCTEDFIAKVQAVVDIHHWGALQLTAPLITLSKDEVLLLGQKLGVPNDLAYSCDRGGPACGACPSCVSRNRLDDGG